MTNNSQPDNGNSQQNVPFIEGDHIVRAIGLKGQVRAVAVQGTEMVQEITERQGLSPVPAVALGRLSMGAQLLSVDLDDGESMTVIIRGDGPIGTMTSVVDSQGYVRSLVSNPIVEPEYHQPGKLDIGQAVGSGTLTVIRELKNKRPQTGIVELISGEIAEDLTYYLASSAQIPSIVALGVRVSGKISEAAGLMIQLLPGATEETIAYLEARAAGFPEISYLLAEGFTPAQLIDLFLGDPELEYLDAYTTGFRCTCSEENMERALTALSLEDLEELAEDAEGIDITCDFCRTAYHFAQDSLQGLLKGRLSPKGETE